MTPAVEIFSATDPVYYPVRGVWYWLEFEGKKSEPCTDWAIVDKWADALCREHDTCLVDRSDKGSGLLLASLQR